MSIFLELPADLEASLRAEAHAQGRNPEDIIADALTHYWNAGEEFEEDPDAVAEIAQALAEMEEAEARGEKGMTLEEAQVHLEANLAAHIAIKPLEWCKSRVA